MRLVYVIVAHQLPEQVIRLVRRLAGPESSFILHWDARSPDDELELIRRSLAGEAPLRVLRRRPCWWGTWSIMDATLDGVAAACEAGPFDRVILLTGQDYPIKPRSAMEALFESAGDRSHVHHLPFPKADWENGGWSRVERWHYPPGRANRVRQRIANRWHVPRRFPAGLHPHGGAQLWVLTEEAARYVDRFRHERPEVARFYEHVFVPDEQYVQTVLACSPLADRLVNDCLHFLEWERKGNVLVESDLPSLHHTYHLFARKFDARVDAALLDAIDERLIV